MTSETPLRHYLPAALGNRAIKIVLVGCGGNGAQMLMGLASLDTALRAISSRSLDVTVVDDDIVSEANLGRQPFFRCDIGNSKARTLTERINLAHGLAWTAVHGRAPEAAKLDGTDIVYLATRESQQYLRTASRVGRRLPAYATALGKALLAERFGVSAAAVSKVIARLKRDGLAEARPYRGVFLTEKGSELAEKVERRLAYRDGRVLQRHLHGARAR